MVSCINDFQSTANWLIEHEFGIPLGEWEYWDYPKHNLSKAQWSWLWSSGIRKGLFRHGHLYKGVPEALNRMAGDGHELVVITSRPPEANRDTLAWLAFHQFPLHEVHILPNRKKSTVSPKCDLYIDDNPQNTGDLLANTTGQVILWDRPWNRGIKDGSIRVNSWDQVFRVMENMEDLA